MTIEVEVRHKLGDFSVAANFRSTGRVTALFGASGSGKTTLVNAMAGLLTPEAGRIVVDGKVLFDSTARINVPAHRRRIGYVFQDARLFPHMSVRKNLAYGLKFLPQGDRNGDTARITDLLGIGPLLDRAPGDLSGGERQRVAIGRAPLCKPEAVADG